MKKTLVCPKCEGRVLWRIESMRLPANDQQTLKAAISGAPAKLPIHVRSAWSGFASQGGFEVFICKACGFTEWYAHGLEELSPDEKNGVQLIDNRPKPERL
jgi:predicted nucleic-acid-binding Zn-ribbon protein